MLCEQAADARERNSGWRWCDMVELERTVSVCDNDDDVDDGF